jgi:hypothetical protein
MVIVVNGDFLKRRIAANVALLTELACGSRSRQRRSRSGIKSLTTL